MPCGKVVQRFWHVSVVGRIRWRVGLGVATACGLGGAVDRSPGSRAALAIVRGIVNNGAREPETRECQACQSPKSLLRSSPARGRRTRFFGIAILSATGSIHIHLGVHNA